MIGTKLDKPLQDDWIIDQETGEKQPNPAPNTLSKYSALATWCNDNHATIEDKGEYYECVAIPQPALEEVKARKKQELITARDNEENKPITTDKGKFDFDTLSRTRLLNAMNAMTDLQTREWTTVDKVVVVMYKADFQEIFNTASVRSDEAFAKWKNLKSQVNNATTVEEVQAIKWEEDDG